MSEETTNPTLTAATSAEPLRVQPVRFCGKCGAAWQEDWTDCRNCVTRNEVRSRANADVLSVAEEKRSIINAIALYGSLLTVSIVAIIVVSAQGTHLDFHQFMIEVSVFCTIITVWSIGSYRSLRPVLSKTGPALWLAAAPGFGVTTFVLASLALFFMSKAFGIETLKYLRIFTRAGYGLGMGILFIAVQPAIFEEVAFRGIIFQSLRKVTGSTEAIFASAAMFAILHLSIPSFLHLFLLGIVLAWLREKTGALYAGMLVHFIHNFLCLLQEHYNWISPW